MSTGGTCWGSDPCLFCSLACSLPCCGALRCQVSRAWSLQRLTRVCTARFSAHTAHFEGCAARVSVQKHTKMARTPRCFHVTCIASCDAPSVNTLRVHSEGPSEIHRPTCAVFACVRILFRIQYVALIFEGDTHLRRSLPETLASRHMGGLHPPFEDHFRLSASMLSL